MIRPRNKITGGFTFIELLIVVAIIAGLSVMAFPRFRESFERLKLESFAKEVYMLCLLLQDSATTKGEPHCFSILENREFNAYSVTNGTAVPLEGRFRRNLKAPSGVICQSSESEVCFQPDAGSLDAEITISLDKEVRKIKISGASGEISIP